MNIVKKTFCLTLLTIQSTYSWVPLHVSKINALDRMKHLELIWKIREEMDVCDVSNGDVCGGECVECEGYGENQCNYCGGTGFLMMGDDLIGTNNDCPVCKGTGMIQCKKCMGAGYIVEWREDYDNSH
tara:strand:- start:51 stop:434 length:384 start_codon:yes stop_codon:yes gene_type:complete